MRTYHPIFIVFVLSGIVAIVSILALSLGLNDPWHLWKIDPLLQLHRRDVYSKTISVLLRSLCFMQLSAFLPFLRDVPNLPDNAEVADCRGLLQILGEQRYFYTQSAAYTMQYRELRTTLDNIIDVAHSSHHPNFTDTVNDDLSPLLEALVDGSRDSREALLRLIAHIDLGRTGALQLAGGVLRALRLGRTGLARRDLRTVDTGKMMSFSLSATASCVHHIIDAAQIASKSIAALRRTVLTTRNVMQEAGVCAPLSAISARPLARPGVPPQTTASRHGSCSLLERLLVYDPSEGHSFAGHGQQPVNVPSVVSTLAFFQDQLEDLVMMSADVGESITRPLRRALANTACPLGVAIMVLQTEYAHLCNLDLSVRSSRQLDVDAPSHQ